MLTPVVVDFLFAPHKNCIGGLSWKLAKSWKSFLNYKPLIESDFKSYTLKGLWFSVTQIFVLFDAFKNWISLNLYPKFNSEVFSDPINTLTVKISLKNYALWNFNSHLNSIRYQNFLKKIYSCSLNKSTTHQLKAISFIIFKIKIFEKKALKWQRATQTPLNW